MAVDPHAALDKQELANERTDWAKLRTALANQRTFAAWIRTGLAGVGFGFAALRLLEGLEPRWAVVTLGATLVLLGVGVLLLGARSYRRASQQIEMRRAVLPFDILGALALVFALMAIAIFGLFVLGQT